MSAPRTASGLEQAFARQLQLAQVAPPVPEYRFHPTRRWRFDFAWPDQQLALEIEGGVFIAGRHSRGAGYRADCEKASAAAILGWRVLRVTGDHVRNGQALQWTQAALDQGAA